MANLKSASTWALLLWPLVSRAQTLASCVDACVRTSARGSVSNICTPNFIIAANFCITQQCAANEQSDDLKNLASFCSAYNGLGSSSTISATPSPSPSCTNEYYACSDDSGCSNGNVCKKAANQPVGNCYCASPASTLSSSSLASSTSSAPTPSASCTNEYFACSDDAGCSNGNVCRKSPNEPVGNCYCPIVSSMTSSAPAPTSSCSNQYFACVANQDCSGGNVCVKAANQPVGNCYCPPLTSSSSAAAAVGTGGSTSGNATTVTTYASPSLTPTPSVTSTFNGEADMPRAAVGMIGFVAAAFIALF